MANNRGGPAPPPRPGQVPRVNGARSERANRRLATVLGGGLLAVALGAVAWAGLSGGGSSTPSTDAGSTVSSNSVMGPSIPKASPVATAGVVGPAVSSPAPTKAAAVVAAPKAVASAPASAAPSVASAAPLPVATKVAAQVAKPVTKVVAKPVAKPVVASSAQGGHVASRAIVYRVAKGDSLWTLTQKSLVAPVVARRRATWRPS